MSHPFAAGLGLALALLPAPLLAPNPPADPAPAPDHASGLPWAHGVFGHDSARTERFQTRTGRPVDVIGVHPTRGSWERIRDPWWLDVAPAGFSGTLDVAVPLWQDDGDLATVATGGDDAQWEALGRMIHERYPGSTVRIGWEFNLGSWNHHASAATAEQWAQGYRRAAAALKRGGPSLLAVWNPNKGRGDSLPDATSAYPGDDVVDVIGLDAYDWWPAYDAATWPEHRDGEGGWSFWIDFTRAHGKRFSVPEWGVAPGNPNGGGDNPGYIEAVLDFLDSHRDVVHSVIYFDEPAPYMANSIADGQVPQAAAAYVAQLDRIAGRPPEATPPAPDPASVPDPPVPAHTPWSAGTAPRTRPAPPRRPTPRRIPS